MLVICGLLTVLEPKPPYFCCKTVKLLYSSWQRVQEKGSKKIPWYKICHLWEALLIKRYFSDLGKEHVFRRHFFLCHTSKAISKNLPNFVNWEMLHARPKVHKMQDLILPCSSGWSLSLLSFLQQNPSAAERPFSVSPKCAPPWWSGGVRRMVPAKSHLSWPHPCQNKSVWVYHKTGTAQVSLMPGVWFLRHSLSQTTNVWTPFP